jgi:ABC-type sugar transport system substrate-binding protein
MRVLKRALMGAAVALVCAAPLSGASAKSLTILTSVPGLNFPFFVHMMNELKGK